MNAFWSKRQLLHINNITPRVIFVNFFSNQDNLHQNMKMSSRIMWTVFKGHKTLDCWVEAEKQPYWICFCCYGNCSATVYPWMLRTSLWLRSCWAFFWQTVVKLFLACNKFIKNGIMFSEPLTVWLLHIILCQPVVGCVSFVFCQPASRSVNVL